MLCMCHVCIFCVSGTEALLVALLVRPDRKLSIKAALATAVVIAQAVWPPTVLHTESCTFRYSILVTEDTDIGQYSANATILIICVDVAEAFVKSARRGIWLAALEGDCLVHDTHCVLIVDGR